MQPGELAAQEFSSHIKSIKQEMRKQPECQSRERVESYGIIRVKTTEPGPRSDSESTTRCVQATTPASAHAGLPGRTATAATTVAVSSAAAAASCATGSEGGKRRI